MSSGARSGKLELDRDGRLSALWPPRSNNGLGGIHKEIEAFIGRRACWRRCQGRAIEQRIVVGRFCPGDMMERDAMVISVVGGGSPERLQRITLIVAGGTALIIIEAMQ